MSLILDALKRAERDRRAERSAVLDDVPPSRAPRAGRRWGRWLGLALLALVAIGMTVSLVRQRSKRPHTVAGPAMTAQPRAQPVAPAPKAAPPTQTFAPIPARPAPAVIPGTEGVASLDDLTQGTTEDLPPVASPAPEAAAQPAPVEPEPEAGPEAKAAVTAPVSEPAAPATPPEIPPALTQQAPVRKLREMPPDYRADFPALTVEVHVFEQGRRFVMINGRRYREGERLAEGPQIVEIVRDGIVLEYRGEKVLYTLGR